MSFTRRQETLFVEERRGHEHDFGEQRVPTAKHEDPAVLGRDELSPSGGEKVKKKRRKEEKVSSSSPKEVLFP